MGGSNFKCDPRHGEIDCRVHDAHPAAGCSVGRQISATTSALAPGSAMPLVASEVHGASTPSPSMASKPSDVVNAITDSSIAKSQGVTMQ